MAKTDFTKAEELLKQGLQEFKVKDLINLAKRLDPKQKESKTNQDLLRKRSLLALERDLKRLLKLDLEELKKLKISKKEILYFLKNGDKMSDEEWQKVEKIRHELHEFQKSLKKESIDDDSLIENERLKHINKRFNVKDDWLPLK